MMHKELNMIVLLNISELPLIIITIWPIDDALGNNL